MKRIFVTIVKWSWFCLLLLVAFGYMASGLSETDIKGNREIRLSRIGNSGATETSRNTSRQGVDAAAKNSIASQSSEWSSHEDDSIAQIVAAVNTERNDHLLELGVVSADSADWLTVCRRLSLALIGSGLSLEEIRALQQLPVEQRQQRHLNNLLQDSRFSNYWAERWTRYLVGADGGPFVVYRRRRFRHWLTDQIAANRTYDSIVKDLITAEGLWTDRPEVNFLTVTFDSNDGKPDPIRLAARTSRAFLGLRIDCLQCHNDFLGNVNLGELDSIREGQQADFHELAAFFSSAKSNGIQGIRTGEADYRYQYLDETEEIEVTPGVPFSPDLLPASGDQRSRLATWVTHQDNRQFARAAVVRFWALMFGRSPTEAVDNLPLDEPLPPMLEPIVDDFQKHRDVRRTIQIIARSDAFRVSSRADFDITPKHEEYYAVFPLTRLRAEQVAGSIVQAAKIKTITRDSSFLVQLIRFGSINDFLERYGDLGENEFSKDGITIPQRLLMLNGNMLREAGELNPVLNATGHINLFAGDDPRAVETMFLCLLNRYPTEEERTYFIDCLRTDDDRGKGLEDLYWTLANSTEFTWNH